MNASQGLVTHWRPRDKGIARGIQLKEGARVRSITNL
jgi:hypothetical protein